MANAGLGLQAPGRPGGAFAVAIATLLVEAIFLVAAFAAYEAVTFGGARFPWFWATCAVSLGVPLGDVLLASLRLLQADEQKLVVWWASFMAALALAATAVPASAGLAVLCALASVVLLVVSFWL